MEKKYFPIKTATACQLKWAWSTIYLNNGVSRSCHRTGEAELTAENFLNFHNTPVVVADRERMLQGKWPETSCGYCRNIEAAGGVSDRMRQLTVPNLSSEELERDPTLTRVNPTIVEVYFNNACNLGCLYCGLALSSTIEAENLKFGRFDRGGVVIEATPSGDFKELIPHFWQWFEIGFPTLRRLHVLGGEPFYQKEFDRLLEMIEKYPNPECELNIVTNLMLSPDRLDGYLEKFKKLLANRRLKRIDITCSIDCWGPEQEHVRWGIKLEQWGKNFNTLLKNKWLYVSINQTISALTIKTMPELLVKLAQWRKTRQVGHWFATVYPGPTYMKGNIFGQEEFGADAEKILALMPQDTEENCTAYEHMKGIFNEMFSTGPDINEIQKLIVFLDEKDRRRGTNWEQVFPWLKRYRNYVV